MRLLCLVVSKYVPEYAIHTMVLELLQLDGSNWESPMSGLMALLSILGAAPALIGGVDLTPIELQASVQVRGGQPTSVAFELRDHCFEGGYVAATAL
jgi:hypothetical protein